jgi:hypothetical protein
MLDTALSQACAPAFILVATYTTVKSKYTTNSCHLSTPKCWMLALPPRPTHTEQSHLAHARRNLSCRIKEAAGKLTSP